MSEEQEILNSNGECPCGEDCECRNQAENSDTENPNEMDPQQKNWNDMIDFCNGVVQRLMMEGPYAVSTDELTRLACFKTIFGLGGAQ